MVFTFLENALNLGIFTQVPPHSKLAPKFLSSHLRQKEITRFSREHFFENLFPPTAERVQETMICFTKIQSENMMIAWGIITLFIFCMICNFFKRDGFTIL